MTDDQKDFVVGFIVTVIVVTSIRAAVAHGRRIEREERDEKLRRVEKAQQIENGLVDLIRATAFDVYKAARDAERAESSSG